MKENISSDHLPAGLRSWFILHFVVDLIFAIPLILIPAQFLHVAGWESADPVSPRLVGAALLAIGIESWLGRNAGKDAFRAMLNLKIIWASFAIVGLALGLAEGAPDSAWIFLLAFAGFLGVWVFYRRKV
jgi:hypothetical protein